MLKATIFDMDGVLIDSQPLHFMAEKETASHFGHPIGEEELKQYLGWREEEFWKELIRRYSLPATFEEMREFDRGIVEGYLQEAAKPDESLAKILLKLRGRGMKLAVASSSWKRAIGIVLGGLGIREYFDAVVCGAEVERGKPEPDIFMLAAKKMGVGARDCAVVEDAPSGIRAANTAGMLSIALMGKVNAGLDFSEADEVISSLDELPGVIAKNSCAGRISGHF
ncbi:HAD family phosphatase [Candidatus Micrarchaeota archaeon]|nr:HAD family phosphatase [Candidatus Micrarchaeota archaeon]